MRITPTRRHFAATIGFALTTTAASQAEAQYDNSLEAIVSPGITFSFSHGASRSVWGVGFELSVFPAFQDIGPTGWVSQVQWLSDGSYRFALSAEVFGPFVGLEAGVAYRSSTTERASSVALRLTPFVGAAYVYASYELNFTLGNPSGVRGFERFLHLGLKAPLAVRPHVIEPCCDPTVSGP